MKTGGGDFTSLDGIVINPTPINTTNGAKVFALLYSYNSKTIYSVNLTDNELAGSTTLNVSKQIPYSGASPYLAGGIADGKRSLIWLATGDGLYGINPSDLKQNPKFIAQPASTIINENLGGDPAKDIIYSPNYDNTGLVVFNLAESKAYQVNSSDWSSLIKSWNPYGRTIDGAALDSVYNVAVMFPEGASSIGLLTYATPSGASSSVGTISNPGNFKLYPITANFMAPSGGALDPITHTVLMVGEGYGLSVGVLDDPSSADWKGFSKYVDGGTSKQILFFSP